jgi:hypothetical protein
LLGLGLPLEQLFQLGMVLRWPIELANPYADADANSHTYAHSHSHAHTYALGQHHWRDLLLQRQPVHLLDGAGQRHL